MKRELILTAAFIVGMTACGSDGGVAATAREGDEFCKLAEVADADNDDLDALSGEDPAEIKRTLGGAIDSLAAAVAKAPKDIADTAQTLLENEEELEKLLKKYDYDVVKMSESDDGKAFLESDAGQEAGDDFEAYLDDKCGIAPNDSPDDTTADTTADTTPSDTTGDTVPSDTTGGSTVDTIVDLGEGEDAINQFLDYYELGTGQDLTDEQRQCIVDALVDKVTGEELNQAISGNSSDKVNQALGLAFLNCNLVS
ncbi:MAG TPA: hypothetical protein VH761_13940 [Ilumatobacteraceae bacterium]|jgi:hypothetical protein